MIRFESWLRRAGLQRPELRAWAMYDWANSAVFTTIVTAVFPIYYRSVVAGDLSDEARRRSFTLATLFAMVFIAGSAPLLGALADRRSCRKILLLAFAALGIVAVGGLFFVGPGDWKLGLALFAVANVGVSGSIVFFDALLPHVARRDELNRVSTAGFALGYAGGGLLLALQLLWISKPAWFGLPTEGTLPVRLALLSVAVWWAVFTLPLVRHVHEPAAAREEGAPRTGLITTLLATLRELRSHKHALLLLIAFLIYNDGIVTIIRLATLYGDERGLSHGTMIGAILLVQFLGVPFALLFGRLSSKIGAKRSILLGLAVYAFISVLGYHMDTALEFWALAILVGMVQGGTQALSRSLFASMIPRDKSGQFFGLFAIGEKFAGIFGPALFYLIDVLTGSSRAAILSILVFFVVGGALLTRVDVDAGRRAVGEE